MGTTTLVPVSLDTEAWKLDGGLTIEGSSDLGLTAWAPVGNGRMWATGIRGWVLGGPGAGSPLWMLGPPFRAVLGDSGVPALGDGASWMCT